MLFIEGIPDPDQLQSLSNSLIIFDDLNSQYINNHEIMDIFTVGSHHRNISVIVISHNIFAKGKFSREISLNSNYLILFKNPRDQLQLQILVQILDKCFQRIQSFYSKPLMMQPRILMGIFY